MSRLILGCDNQQDWPGAANVFDAFFERGGNIFDTAWIYGGGLPERLLGTWMRSRGLRDQVAVIGKGAHPPCCAPAHVERELDETLERLGTDHVDLYLLHRDNLEVPVGEWVEVLADLARRGKLRAYGGSNWTLERVDAANDYAARHGLPAFAAVSNNLSLAVMKSPVWDGCLTANHPDSLAWFRARRLALMAWSSQARGFFTDRARPDNLSDASLVHCFYSDDNFERQARARELARERGVEPLHIALAWVLAQDFPVFALIGPRSLGELTGSLPALGVALTPEETAWLNLETDARR